MQTKIILRPDGTIETEGFDGRGPRCWEQIEPVINRLGVIKERRLKPEHELTEAEAEQERLHE